MLRGSEAQIDAVGRDDDFQRVMTKAFADRREPGNHPRGHQRGPRDAPWPSTRRRSRSSPRRPWLGCGAVRRTLALWLLLFGVYAATIGLDAFAGSDYGGDEPHYLLAAHSIVHDGDVDVLDEYRARAYADFYPHALRPHGQRDRGTAERAARGGLPAPDRARLRDRRARGRGAVPGGDRGAGDRAGVPAGAARGAGPVGARRRARGRAQPAARSPTARPSTPSCRRRPRSPARRCSRCGLSSRVPVAGRGAVLRPARRAPLARHEVRGRRRGGGRVRGAGDLAGAAADARGRRRGGGAVLRGALTWRSTRRSTAGPRRTRPTTAGETATDAAFPGGYLERAYRLVALFVDRDYGLLRWAPVFALAFAGLWWLWRSRRDRLARAVPGRARDGAHRGPVRRGARRAAARGRVPRADDVRLLVPAAPPDGRAAARGAARGVGPAARAAGRASCCPALTVGASAWLYADVRWGDGSLAADRPDAPFGPLTDALPLFARGGGWPFWLAGAIGVAVAARSSCARRSPRATRARPRAPRARGTRGSARTSGRWCGGGSGSGPRPARSRWPQSDSVSTCA